VKKHQVIIYFKKTGKYSWFNLFSSQKITSIHKSFMFGIVRMTKLQNSESVHKGIFKHSREYRCYRMREINEPLYEPNLDEGEGTGHLQ